jgi:signal transduction histidine kinase/integral membrane sensor domain MASE1
VTAFVLQPLNGKRAVIANLILAATYIAAGRFGLSLAFQFPSASPVWPPSGIALAALIIFGQRLAPGVLIGATIVNATTPGTPLLAASLIAIGNTLEAVVGAYLVANYARGRKAFNAPRDIIKAIFLAAICATTISATVGVTSLAPLGSSNWEGFWPIWLTWWLGDAVSIVVLTPFLLLWFDRPMPRLSAKRLGEVAAAFLILALIGQLVFQAAAPGLKLYHFLTVPPLLWVAYRFGRRGASLAVLVLSAIAIAGTVRGLGPFILRDANESLLFLQAFIGTVSVTVLVVAAAVAEQMRSEQFLRVQYGISRVLAEASSLADAAPKILKAVCEAAGWELGAIWRVDSDAGMLRCVECWHLPSVALPEFERDSRARTFPSGAGLPGRIWAAAQPAWVRDVTKDDNFPRAPVAAREGLRGAFGFPILLNNEVLGVIEFFSRDVREPDQNFLEMIGAVGSQIGPFIERKEGEAALRVAKEQLRTYADELEGRVARRTARLRATVESLESFSYSIAHDLRAPVRGMAGFARMLQEDYGPKLDADAHKYIGRILENAARMDRLILDLLAYGKMTHMELTQEPVPLEPVIRGAMEQLSGEIGASGAKIDLPASLPKVTGHRIVLEQVFTNLLGNALKFVAPGVTPQIEITTQTNGDTVCVWVRDNGIGIPSTAHERIFNVFERAHAGNKYAGTGIGLAIVRKALERLGGRVGVESEPGKGSCFWLELPAA